MAHRTLVLTWVPLTKYCSYSDGEGPLEGTTTMGAAASESLMLCIVNRLQKATTFAALEAADRHHPRFPILFFSSFVFVRTCSLFEYLALRTNGVWALNRSFEPLAVPPNSLSWGASMPMVGCLDARLVGWLTANSLSAVTDYYLSRPPLFWELKTPQSSVVKFRQLAGKEFWPLRTAEIPCFICHYR